MSLSRYDFIVIGAGSAGCTAAAGLSMRGAGSVLVIEAGPSDRTPLVRMPFGLIWMMGSKRRDWRFSSTPQAGLGGRKLNVPRGKTLGGSGSINSMVWFRGRGDDFDSWHVPGWTWAEVAPAFEEVEAQIVPSRLAHPHPLSEGLHSLLGGNGHEPPTPEYESAGVFHYNIRNGRRWSAADAFLRPAMAKGVKVLQSHSVARLGFDGDRATHVVLSDDTEIRANKGIVLSAGSIGSPAILFASGIGPAGDLRAAGIDPRLDAEGVGANLHDHPAVGVHHSGPHSGYGLALSQAQVWASAPFQWALGGRGVFASPVVEGGAFFNAAGDGAPPDVQCHFIPFYLGWEGRRYQRGRGYFADVGICRPKSRGALRLGRTGLEIDLGVLRDPADTDLLIKGFRKLRQLMAEADFGTHAAPEAFPGASVETDAQIRAHVIARAATAYHPVGTLRMGVGDAPVSPRLAVKGVEGLWVADASVMPAVTSANTNAPSMMIGHRAGQFIAEDVA